MTLDSNHSSIPPAKWQEALETVREALAYGYGWSPLGEVSDEAHEAFVTLEAALRELEERCEALQRDRNKWWKLHQRAEAEVERLRTIIRATLNELGVPGDGYPAPVANAVDLLNAALFPAGEAETDEGGTA